MGENVEQVLHSSLPEDNTMLRKSLVGSIVGFNGSPHCDKSSPEAFYESWRKRQMREDRRRKISLAAGVLSKRNRW